MSVYEFARLTDAWSILRDGKEIGFAPKTLSRRDARVIEGVLNGKPFVPGMWPEDDSDEWQEVDLGDSE